MTATAIQAGATASSYLPKTPAVIPTPDCSQFIPLTSPAAGTALTDPKEWPQNEKVPLLFQPIEIGGMTFKNRIFLAPMCQYSTDPANNLATNWQLVHLGALAARGAAYVTTEAAAVMKNGRLSPGDLGFWSDAHGDALKATVEFIKSQGAVSGIQLNHAGRKASTLAPWISSSTTTSPMTTHIATTGSASGWEDVWAPSSVPFIPGAYCTPTEMTLAEIEEFKQSWAEAVVRADRVGFDVVEVHAAHGYLLHQFLSPIANQRTDNFGGSLENRLRLPLEIIALTRKHFPSHKPIFLRISATDWHPNGERNAAGEYISWGPEQSQKFVEEAIKLGVGLVDVSSGGVDKSQKIPVVMGYQVPLAEELKKANPNVVISTVGLIVNGTQAEEILQSNKADVVTIGREFLRHADLVFDWAQELNTVVNVPVQYQRAHTRMFKHRVQL